MSVEEIRKAYIIKLRSAVEAAHQCRAAHRRTIATRPSRDPKWPSQVEVFWLTGHPTAKRCFAWSDPGEPAQVIAVLEIPPVIGAATAIQAALASKSRNLLPNPDAA
jgi:hypothetical protein